MVDLTPSESSISTVSENRENSEHNDVGYTWQNAFCSYCKINIANTELHFQSGNDLLCENCHKAKTEYPESSLRYENTNEAENRLDEVRNCNHVKYGAGSLESLIEMKRYKLHAYEEQKDNPQFVLTPAYKIDKDTYITCFFTVYTETKSNDQKRKNSDVQKEANAQFIKDHYKKLWWTGNRSLIDKLQKNEDPGAIDIHRAPFFSSIFNQAYSGLRLQACLEKVRICERSIRCEANFSLSGVLIPYGSANYSIRLVHDFRINRFISWTNKQEFPNVLSLMNTLSGTAIDAKNEANNGNTNIDLSTYHFIGDYIENGIAQMELSFEDESDKKVIQYLKYRIKALQMKIRYPSQSLLISKSMNWTLNAYTISDNEFHHLIDSNDLSQFLHHLKENAKALFQELNTPPRSDDYSDQETLEEAQRCLNDAYQDLWRFYYNTAKSIKRQVSWLLQPSGINCIINEYESSRNNPDYEHLCYSYNENAGNILICGRNHLCITNVDSYNNLTEKLEKAQILKNFVEIYQRLQNCQSTTWNIDIAIIKQKSYAWDLNYRPTGSDKYCKRKIQDKDIYKFYLNGN